MSTGAKQGAAPAAIEAFEAAADRLTTAAARRQALRFSRQRLADELFADLGEILNRPAGPTRRVA